jgi:hypothetical protein
VTLVLVLLCEWAARPTPAEVAIPGFTSADTQARRPIQREHRDTLLPGDCAQVLPDTLVPALLAQPEGSMFSRTVVGAPSPSVGMVEQLTCVYSRGADRAVPTLELRLQAYTDPNAAMGHFQINTAAEKDGSIRVTDLSIGTAPSVIVDEQTQSVLLVLDNRSSLTIRLGHGVVPDVTLRPVLIDLAQRVLSVLPQPTPTASNRAPSRIAYR